jgi:hypothetical protein
MLNEYKIHLVHQKPCLSAEVLLSPGALLFSVQKTSTPQARPTQFHSSSEALSKCGSPANPWSTSLFLIMPTSSASPVPYRNISPAKKIRNIKRLLSFQFKQMPTKLISLSISPQEASSFFPPKIQSNLVVSTPSSINIPPNLKNI